eukprot:GHVQ01022895.1.p1 GENE.GHVQ01022895.1~~GHVQ01022895.1.p1  ORF type:complete len:281 (+),score=55.83 GHVQ01022895.1:307-1149(+)
MSADNPPRPPTSGLPPLSQKLYRCTESSCKDRPSQGFSTNKSGLPPPPDRGEIGRAAWLVLHTAAANLTVSKKQTSSDEQDSNDKCSNPPPSSSSSSCQAHTQKPCPSLIARSSSTSVSSLLPSTLKEDEGSAEPNSPSTSQLERSAWLWSFAHTYPCHICRPGIIDFFRTNPPDAFSKSSLPPKNFDAAKFGGGCDTSYSSVIPESSISSASSSSSSCSSLSVLPSYRDKAFYPLGSPEQLSLWVCHLHNFVNDETSAPIYPCVASDLIKRYGGSESEG